MKKEIFFFLAVGLSIFLSPLKAEPLVISDHQAKIFEAEGDVKILKANTEEWKAAEKGTLIEAGDQMMTGEKSYVDIVYDEKFLNIARIKEKTKATFKSIEPTEVDLEDGGLFNALDGLEAGESYQIVTPTAVAAVRGTHFTADYDALTQVFDFATLPVPEDNRESSVEVRPLLGNGEVGAPVAVDEGFQLKAQAGQLLEAVLVTAVPSEKIEEAKGMLGGMREGIVLAEEVVKPEEGEKTPEEKVSESSGTVAPSEGEEKQADEMALMPGDEKLDPNAPPVDSAIDNAVMPQGDNPMREKMDPNFVPPPPIPEGMKNQLGKEGFVPPPGVMPPPPDVLRPPMPGGDFLRDIPKDAAQRDAERNRPPLPPKDSTGGSDDHIISHGS